LEIEARKGTNREDESEIDCHLLLLLKSQSKQQCDFPLFKRKQQSELLMSVLPLL